jgi:hypothetical protein
MRSIRRARRAGDQGRDERDDHEEQDRTAGFPSIGDGRMGAHRREAKPKELATGYWRRQRAAAIVTG